MFAAWFGGSLAGAIASGMFNILADLNGLPRLPVDEGTTTTYGIITAIVDYKASLAQWHADRRARRPKVVKLLARRPAVLVIDLTGLTFMGSAGLDVLVKTHRVAGPGVVRSSLGRRNRAGS